MILEQLTGNLIQGLVLGAVYGMATMGLSLIFGVLKVVNVGHGAFIMVGAFITLMLFNALGLIPIFAIPVAFIIGMGLGLIFYYSAIKRLIKAPELATLLVTFAIGVLLEEFVKLIFGSEFRGYNWTIGKLNLGVTVLPLSKLYACIGSALIAVMLYLCSTKPGPGRPCAVWLRTAKGPGSAV
jgi:branched-chain amino acid transport system permease protein